MSGSNSAERKRYEPLVLVETADLSEEDWLDYRRRGIGGSDVSAIFGTSPFRTARDLYYDKLNIASVEDDEGNWVAMEMGHLLEPLVAKIFERKTGYRVYQIKKMFQHPQYPWMLADVDYFVELPDGTTAILEIKTTNYNARDNWWMNGKETVPVYYESQGRHYMAVTDLDRCFFCCLYGGYDFRQLPDFGEILHNNIHDWFCVEDNFCIWEELQTMMSIQKPAVAEHSEDRVQDNPFVGKTIVVTGKVEPYTRDGINDLIESLGAHAGSSVSKKTDYLVCGENAGSKLSKARDLGVTVLSPAEFFSMAGAE